MTGVILAAGRGTRMGLLTEHLPKPLIAVGERTCLEIALEALMPVVDRIIVVTGYLSARVEDHLGTRSWPKPLHAVHNPEHARGNLLSLAAARSRVKDGSFVLSNADHLFPPDFYTRYFPAGENITVATQHHHPILADEMKVKVDVAGRLQGISKTLPNYDGAYIGATCVPAGVASAYWTAFDRVYASTDLDTACVEDVLATLALGDTRPLVVWVNAVDWFEIDTPDDLEKARRGLG